MSGFSDLAGLVTFRPLDGVGRKPARRQRSAFRASWTDTVQTLADELRHLRAKRVVLEIDMREQDFRIDGMPRANAVAATPWVVLSMDVPGPVGHLRYEVGTYDHWQDNVRGIALALRALRAVDRYGVTKRGEQYAGWKALPAGGPSPQRGADLIREHGSVRAALMATHPDRGGDPEDFAAVQAAREGGGRHG